LKKPSGCNGHKPAVSKSSLRLRDEGNFSAVPPCLMVVVELRGLEPLTFSMPLRRAPNCATAPRYPSALRRGNDRYSATTTSTFHRCGSQASSAFRRYPSALCRDPTFARLSVGMAYYSCSQPFRLLVFPKSPRTPTLLLLYHKPAISANLIHVAERPRSGYGGVPGAMQSRERIGRPSRRHQYR
jgi:hypothetical protein